MPRFIALSMLSIMTALFIAYPQLVYAEGPSLDVTINFINKVINSDEISSVSHGKVSTSYKPVLTAEDECRYKFSQRFLGDTDIGKDYPIFDFTLYYWADLSKHKVSYEPPTDNKRSSILIEDRKGIETIRSQTASRFGKETTYRKVEKVTKARVNLRVRGVYAGKLDKALQHLSKICFDKYGTKEDKDPF